MQYDVYKEVLLEIAFSLSGEFDLQNLLKNCLPKFLRKLDCTAAAVINSLEEGRIELAMPKIIASSQIFHHAVREISREMGAQDSRDWLSLEREDALYYGFRLEEFGILILARSRPLDKFFVQELLSVIQMLARSCRACLEVEKRKEIEEELASSKALLEATLNSITDIIGIQKPDRTLMRYNRAGYEFLGLPPEQVQGNKCFALLGRSAPCPDCTSDHAVAAKEKAFNEIYLQEYGKYLESVSQPVLNSSGQVYLVVEQLRDITERKQMEDVLRRSESYYRTIFETSGSAMLILEQDTIISRVNWNLERITGYSREEIEGIMPWPDLVHSEDLQWMKEYHELRRSDPYAAPKEYEFRFITRNGEIRHGLLTIDMIPETTKSVVAVVDITEQKKAEEKLRQSEHYYRTIFETTEASTIIISEDTTISLVNSNFEELSGYSREEVEGKKSWTDFIPPEDIIQMKNYHYLRRKDPESAPKQYEHRFLDRSGGEHHVILSVDLIQGTSQSVASWIDITERKIMEQRLQEMSIYDSLTGLYNRTFFDEEMTRLSDSHYSPLGIIVCDLDGMKFVNDTLGHQAGDRMLINAAYILRQCFRSSDIVARIGGDEFAVLLPQTGPETMERMLQRLRGAVQEYYSNEPELPLDLSMGHAASDTTGDLHALFREADNLMYREKIQQEGNQRNAILQSLTRTIQARDFDTEGHCDRLQELASSLARSLGYSQEVIDDLFLLARFHDMGKVGIPDHILFKQGNLTDEEWQQMRQHCEIGHRIASSVPDLKPIADLILKHHEHWDGGGYPLGLSGKDIPLQSRILAIVDAYDAMTSERPYRKAMSSEETIAELKRCAGTQFDPDLVEKFIQVLQEFDSK